MEYSSFLDLYFFLGFIVLIKFVTLNAISFS